MCSSIVIPLSHPSMVEGWKVLVKDEGGYLPPVSRHPLIRVGKFVKARKVEMTFSDRIHEGVFSLFLRKEDAEGWCKKIWTATPKNVVVKEVIGDRCTEIGIHMGYPIALAPSIAVNDGKMEGESFAHWIDIEGIPPKGWFTSTDEVLRMSMGLVGIYRFLEYWFSYPDDVEKKIVRLN